MSVFAEFALTLCIAFLAGLTAYALARRVFVPILVQARGQGSGIIFPLRRRTVDRIFVLFALGYVGVFGLLAILRYESLNSELDLPVFGQVLWSSFHGIILENPTLGDSRNYLGTHFSPMLLALIPLVTLWGEIPALLITQTIALGMVALPLFWFARAQVGGSLALVIAFLYFLSPALQYVNLYDFHEISLAAPLYALAAFFVLRSHYTGFFVSMGLAMLASEETALILVGFGVFIFFLRSRKLGLLTIALGCFSCIALLMYVMPTFTQGVYLFVNRYTYLGKTIPEIASGIFANPGKVLNVVATPEKLEYVSYLLIPLGLFPLAGIEVLFFSFPTFTYLLLSDYPAQTSIHYQYSAPLLPFLYFAAVVGVRRVMMPPRSNTNANGAWEREKLARQIGIATLLMGAGIASYYLFAPGPLARQFDQAKFALDARDSLGRSLAASIPQEGIVVTQSEWIAHLSDRIGIYNVEYPSVIRRADYLFVDKDRLWYKLRQGAWDFWLTNGYFQIVSEKDNFVVAKRTGSESAMRLKFGDALTLSGYTLFPKGPLRGGTIASPILEWSAAEGIANNYKIHLQVVDAQGHSWAEDGNIADEGFTPTNRFEEGHSVADPHRLRLPPTMPPGNYQIILSVQKEPAAIEGNDYLQAQDDQGNMIGTEAVLTTVRIGKDKSSYTVSDLVKEQPLTALLVDMKELRFLGYVPPRETITPGETLQVGLYWRAREKPLGDYIVAVQLRDAKGRMAVEHRSRPANDTYPTTQWDAGEVLLDWHDFNLPRDLPTGTWQIAVVLQDSTNNAVLGEALLSTISVVN